MLTLDLAELRPFLQYSSDKKHVLCTLCATTKKAGTGKPTLAKNFQSHLRSDRHVGAWSDELARREWRQQELDMVSAAYDAAESAQGLLDPGPISPLYCPPMFDETQPDIQMEGSSTTIFLSDSELLKQLGEGEQLSVPEKMSRLGLLLNMSGCWKRPIGVGSPGMVSMNSSSQTICLSGHRMMARTSWIALTPPRSPTHDTFHI
jgi:hypothetical protein